MCDQMASTKTSQRAQTSSLVRTHSPSELSKLVWNADQSVIQVETLNSYAVPDDDRLFALHLAGHTPTDKDLEGYHAWFSQVRAATQRGVDVVRVHIVPETLNAYLRFEIEVAYLQHCTPAGEKVFLLQRERAKSLTSRIPQDFYLIDGQRLLYPNYDAKTHFVSITEDLSQDSIEAHKKIMTHLMTAAIPLHSFVSRMRGADLSVSLD